MSTLGDQNSLARDLHLRAATAAASGDERQVDVIGRVLTLATAQRSDDRAWALVRLAADLRALGRHEDALRVLDAAWFLQPSEHPELAIFTCAIAIHCDREAHDVAVTLERDFAERGIDLKFGRACVRLYTQLAALTEDDEHLERLAQYRTHVNLLESEDASALAA